MLTKIQMAADPPSKDVRELLSSAVTHVKAGDLDDALTTLKELLERDPKNEIALGLLAAIWCDLGLVQKGTQGLKELLARDPGNPLARIQLGLTQRADGKPELALATWKQGVEAGDIGALYWSAVVKYENGAAEEALKMLTRAAALTGPAHPLHQAVQQLLALVESSRRS